MYCVSRSTTCFAFGPGNAVTSFGNLVSIAVIMISSPVQARLDEARVPVEAVHMGRPVRQLVKGRETGCRLFAHTHAGRRPARRGLSLRRRGSDVLPRERKLR